MFPWQPGYLDQTRGFPSPPLYGFGFSIINFDFLNATLMPNGFLLKIFLNCIFFNNIQ
jgi:hypothetical protein